jgi:DNA-binding PadR family transcriptional regulator
VFQGLVRGLLPLFVLVLMRDGPRPGIEVMRAIDEMSGGTWKPSPGSVYPLLRRLEQEGLIEGDWERTRGAPKRVYQLTAKGRARLPAMGRRSLADLHASRDIIDTHITALEGLFDGGSDG